VNEDDDDDDVELVDISELTGKNGKALHPQLL
jgi:hypothetical protein